MNYMQLALDLAAKGKYTSPNPKVGAVIVKDGRIIGQGYHQKAGEDHAEIIALKSCTESPEGATLYVTLEPCSHYGRTPPCTEALIKAGIKKVVIAAKDPNPKVDGISKLRQAGIETETGIMETESMELNRVFYKYMKTGMPYVYLKAAITLDGKIATSTNDSKWISCDESREWVHDFRKQVDAVAIGANTALVDDPYIKQARLRVIFSRNTPLPNSLRIYDNPTTIIETDLATGLKSLGKDGVSSILVEGGSGIFSEFVKQGLVDTYFFFVCPKIIGDKNALNVFDGFSTGKIKDAKGLEIVSHKKIGTDILIEAR